VNFRRAVYAVFGFWMFVVLAGMRDREIAALGWEGSDRQIPPAPRQPS